jgi:GT2 family glycosyltransferase
MDVGFRELETEESFVGTIEALHGLFDSSWYLKNYVDINLGMGPFAHFLIIGLRAGHSPSAIFEEDLYYRVNPAARDAGGSAVLNYIHHGWRQNKNGHPLVNAAWYTTQLAKHNILPVEPIGHYRKIGWKIGLSPHPLFDTNYYLRENGVVLAEGEDPLTHYLVKGRRHGFTTTPNFDAEWYLAAYPDVRGAGVDPLTHYLLDGFREGRNPSPLFSTNDYLEINDDVKGSDVDPLTHYLMYGVNESRVLPNGLVLDKTYGFSVDPIELDAMSQTPLVSIIMTNLNGERHLEAVFASLAAQTYRNFEIIFVDDASTDNSIPVATALGADKIVALETRTGFAGANNAGLAVAKGELVALLNNDTKVHDSWLEAMVLRLKSCNRIGAVTSKIRFWSRYDRVTFLSANDFEIDRAGLVRDMPYKKIFVRQGTEDIETFRPILTGTGVYSIELYIPRGSGGITVPVTSKAIGTVSIAVNGRPQRILKGETAEGKPGLVVPKEAFDAKRDPGFYIVNNAGSGADDKGMPYDRGFAEVDTGQYDVAGEVPFFCGCSVLIKRNALKGQNLFIGDFVAYYEDSELSHRVRQAGYAIFYEPNSVVYHKHSSTTVERSAFWRKHTAKNAALFRYILSNAEDETIIQNALSHLNHLRHWYPTAQGISQEEKEFAATIPETSTEIVSIARLIKDRVVPGKCNTRVGVFNPYWHTLGGGEAHALNIASCFTDFGFVELISTSDFDVAEMGAYFGVATDKFIKRIVKEMTPDITADYDYFINSCYRSTVVSKAARSFYLVSFPQPHARLEFLKSYTFVANSKYTQSWMFRYWGKCNFASEILYPVIDDKFFLDLSEPVRKDPIILSVGRFASTGHIKNQLETAQAFRAFMERNEDKAHWKLMLIGSVNDRAYLGSVEAALEGLNHEIITDADFDVVLDSYKRAAIYVHASGIGQSKTDAPELFEHFGIAVAQAVGSGCVPIVFDHAGPAEIVTDTGHGYTYATVDEMVEMLESVTTLYDTGALAANNIYETLSNAGRIYDEASFRANITRIRNLELVAEPVEMAD